MALIDQVDDPARTVVSDSAYVLFYRRRDLTTDEPPRPPTPPPLPSDLSPAMGRSEVKCGVNDEMNEGEGGGGGGLNGWMGTPTSSPTRAEQPEDDEQE